MAILNDLAPALREPIGRFHREIIERLAIEGVPAAVIARSVKHPLNEIYLVLNEAKGYGRVLELPQADWLPSSKFGQRLPTVASPKFDRDMALLLMQQYGVTRQQSYLFAQLVRRAVCSREALQDCLRTNRRDPNERRNKKLLDVVIHLLRKRLKNQSPAIIIRTHRDEGYSIDHPTRQTILNRLAGVQ